MIIAKPAQIILKKNPLKLYIDRHFHMIPHIKYIYQKDRKIEIKTKETKREKEIK